MAPRLVSPRLAVELCPLREMDRLYLACYHQDSVRRSILPCVYPCSRGLVPRLDVAGVPKWIIRASLSMAYALHGVNWLTQACKKHATYCELAVWTPPASWLLFFIAMPAPWGGVGPAPGASGACIANA